MARPKSTSESLAETAPESTVTPKAEMNSGVKPTAIPDKRTEGILRCFPAYESLYIDQHGGTYAPQTPESLRGGAVLYKNPFFEPQKRKK